MNSDMVSSYILPLLLFQGVCDMFKHALRTLMMDFSVLYSDVASLVLQTYQTAMHPALLDLAKQVPYHNRNGTKQVLF